MPGRNDYGADHKRRRAAVAVDVIRGRANCWRCGRHIGPGDEWDLGHDDHDRTLYRGPECIPCNRGTAGRRGGLKAALLRRSRQFTQRQTRLEW